MKTWKQIDSGDSHVFFNDFELNYSHIKQIDSGDSHVFF
jgi:hypothetical protein